jgi:hypothetical protein
MSRVRPRCHVCGLVLRDSHVQDQDAAGRWTHRECTDPIVVERELHGMYMMMGLCTRTFVKTVAGERLEMPTTHRMSVNLFKDAVMLRTGVPVAQQRLLLHGFELTDGKLSDYGIITGATVLMVAPRRALVVEALQAVIRHERESTVARLRAELAQTRAERDDAYALFANTDDDIQDELRRPDAPGNARHVLLQFHQNFTAMFGDESFQRAQQRGLGG